VATVKTDELDQWHEYGVYTPGRLISLLGDIDEDMAREFIKNIRLLDFVNDKDIHVLLATEGGDVHWGMQIFDAIKECNSKVTIHAVGPCWSMGAIILQAADHRRISSSATVMIHIGTAEYPKDHVLNINQWVAEHKRVDTEGNDILYKKMKEKNPKFTKVQLNKLLVFDTIYTADKAVEMGLANEVAEHKEF